MNPHNILDSFKIPPFRAPFKAVQIRSGDTVGRVSKMVEWYWCQHHPVAWWISQLQTKITQTVHHRFFYNYCISLLLISLVLSSLSLSVTSMQAKSTSSFDGPKTSAIFLVHCSFFFFIFNFFCKHLTLSFVLWSDIYLQVNVSQDFCFDRNQKTHIYATDTSILDSKICELVWILYSGLVWILFNKKLKVFS